MKWKVHPTLPIEVSEFGYVKKLGTDRIYHVQLTPAKYLKVSLFIKNKSRGFFVHKLILETYVGPAPKGAPFSLHLNGIKTDNRIDNLKWGSREENYRHSVIHGTWAYGKKHGMSKLTDEVVLNIRKKFPNYNRTQRRELELYAKDLGVHIHTLQMMLRGETWRHAGVQTEESSK